MSFTEDLASCEVLPRWHSRLHKSTISVVEQSTFTICITNIEKVSFATTYSPVDK